MRENNEKREVQLHFNVLDSFYKKVEAICLKKGTTIDDYFLESMKNGMKETYENYLNSTIDRWNKLKDEQKEKEEEIQEALLELEKQKVDFIKANKKDIDFLRYLYYETDIRMSMLSEACGLVMRDFRELVGTYKLVKICSTCGDEIVIEISSRSALAEGQNKSYETCKKCKDRREAKYRESAEEAAENLRKLKTMPYKDYLKTDHWKETRHRAYKRANFKCQLCYKGGVELHVHHRTYERRGEEWNNDLIVLCKDCHCKHHDK